MSYRAVFGLALLGLMVVLAVAVFQTAPGYMDADYYYAGGLKLAQGHGFNEMILWNFLDDPAGLPHPSHAYWMPFASLLAALGMKLAGVTSFSAAKIGFIALAAALPPITSMLSFSLNKSRGAGLLSGLLAAVPAFYLAYLPTTDTFGIYMLLGGTFFLLAGERPDTLLPTSISNLRPLLLGLVAGLMHLARADGILWLFLALVAMLYLKEGQERGISSLQSRSASIAFCLAGYLLVMGPWMLRNIAVFGSPLAPGGLRAVWMTAYDELFTYPAATLTMARWWDAGLSSLIVDRLQALGTNLQTVLAVQGEIFMLPLIIIGMWKLRRDRRVKLGMLAWILTLGIMSLVFPYAGARGGFFHSGAALQSLFLALVPIGLDAFLVWMGRMRKWKVSQARPVFSAGLVVMSALLAMVVVWGRVVGANPVHPIWANETERYTRLEASLQAAGALPGEVALVNNAPGYFVASSRPSISIPYGGISRVLAAAGHYGAHYLLLEVNQVEDLYLHPDEKPGLEYLGSVDSTRIFRIQHGSSP